MENFEQNLDSLLKELEQEFKDTPAKKQIVAVDDDREVLKLLKQILGEKYDVTCMADGKMAVNFFKNRTADLILLDYDMPGLTGADVLKTLREDKKTQRIPVVFLTGIADNEKVKEIMALGVSDYILKPINVARLRADVKKILG